MKRTADFGGCRLDGAFQSRNKSPVPKLQPSALRTGISWEPVPSTEVLRYLQSSASRTRQDLTCRLRFLSDSPTTAKAYPPEHFPSLPNPFRCILPPISALRLPPPWPNNSE